MIRHRRNCARTSARTSPRRSLPSHETEVGAGLARALAGEAHELDGEEHAWRSDIGGVTVICGPASHTVLLIGSDPGLVDRAGELLNVI